MQGPGDLSKPLMLCDVSWAQGWGWKTLSPANYCSTSEGEVLELPEITVFNERIPNTGCGPLASNENRAASLGSLLSAQSVQLWPVGF